MGLLRKQNQVHLYTGVHDDNCGGTDIDLSKKYIVCNNGNGDHFSTDSWQEADAKYCEWSGEIKLSPFK